MNLLKMEIEALVDAELDNVNCRAASISALQSAVDLVLPSVSRVFHGLKDNAASARCFVIVMRQFVESMADETQLVKPS